MTQMYQHKTDFYTQGRLGYSAEAVRFIAEILDNPHAHIADMGSGTGIFSAALLEMGYSVFCVEPDAALRRKAEERLCHYERFAAVAASAEMTRLPDRSVDCVTAASAFHWFDPEAFLCECKRIAKPGGHAFFLYNIRQNDDPFSQEQARICRTYCPEFMSFRHGADKAKGRCSAFFLRGYEEKSFSHDLVYSKERFLSRCLSSSYSLDPSQPKYAPYRRALEQLIARYSVDGRISIHNHTVVWYGVIA